MRRRELCCALLLISCGLLSCRDTYTSAPPDLPASLAGGWMLSGITPAPLEQAPPAARQLGAKQVWTAHYRGPAEITVTIYAMPSAPAAFELLQQWQGQAGLALLRRDALLFTAHTASLDPQAAQAFWRDFARKTGAGI